MRLEVAGTGSSGNCYVLEENGKKIILDCGLPQKQILKAIKHDIDSIAAVLVTHEHSDHSKAVNDFLMLGVDVYTPSAVKAKYGRARAVKQGVPIDVDGFKIIPFDLPHDGVENYGYIIKSKRTGEALLYATDFEYVPYVFSNMNIDHFLIECNYTEDMVKDDDAKFFHVMRGHCGLNTVIEFLKKNVKETTKNIIFCHLSLSNANAATVILRATETFDSNINIAIAERGITYELSNSIG